MGNIIENMNTMRGGEARTALLQRAMKFEAGGHRFVRALSVFMGGLGALMPYTAPAYEGELPNVIMIMADDLGWSDIAAYRLQQGLTEEVSTPHLDRLVAGGMMFTDAHAPASLCAPTRFSMLTGSAPYRNGEQFGTWVFGNSAAVLRNRKHTTVGEVMQAAGYRTAMIGKMHVGGGKSFDVSDPQKIENTFPTSYGFDYSFVVHDGIQSAPFIYFENDRFLRVDPSNQSVMDSVWGTASDMLNKGSGNDTGPNGLGNRTDKGWADINWNSSQNGIINSDKAVGFIDDHLNNHPGQPFLLHYLPPQVHVPHTPPVDFEPDASGNPGSPVNVPVAGVYGDYHRDMVYEFDLQVGKILAKLDDPDGNPETDDSILANTLIFICSDNGGLPEPGTALYDTTGVLRSTKAHSYEGGHRIPFIAHWGDGTPEGSTIVPGSISDQMIAGHDWVPSMYALTGQSVAENDAMDSVNILPILLGQQSEDDPIRPFLLHQAGKGDSRPDAFGIRRGDYVLILSRSREAMELYNLHDDLSQETDLINPASYGDGTVAQAMLDLADELETLFLQYDEVNDPRSTTAYDADGFSLAPVAAGATQVVMTAIAGVAPVEPVEYRFIETSGNYGGSDSSWQTSRTYTATGLLPNTAYRYQVQMRDGHGDLISPEYAVADVMTEAYTPFSEDVLLSDSFTSGATTAPDNVNVDGANPIGVWFQKREATGVHWSSEDTNTTGSTAIDDVNGSSDSDLEMRLGWAADEVRVLYNTGTAFDLSQDYTLGGDWEILSTFSNTLGFGAGIAVFDSEGELVQTLGLASDATSLDPSNTFGDLVDPTAGETGLFSLTVSSSDLASAGISADNSIGIYFYHDDNGVMGTDPDGFNNNQKNDIYLIDNVLLVKGYNLDEDYDGIPSLVEEATDGLDANDADDGLADLDGDGRSNYDEYVSGTDMLQSSSYLAHSIAITGGTAVIEIAGVNVVEDRIYILECSSDLASGNWLATDAFSPSVAEAGLDYQFTKTLSAEKEFYRVRVEWASE